MIKLIITYLPMLIELLTILLAWELSTILHEFAHFTTAKILGVNVVKVNYGMGSTLLSKKINNTTFCFNKRLSGGSIELDASTPVSMLNHLFITIAAPLLHLTLIFVSLLLIYKFNLGQNLSLIKQLCFQQVVFFLSCAIPHKNSDGMQIVGCMSVLSDVYLYGNGDLLFDDGEDETN